MVYLMLTLQVVTTTYTVTASTTTTSATPSFYSPITTFYLALASASPSAYIAVDSGDFQPYISNSDSAQFYLDENGNLGQYLTYSPGSLLFPANNNHAQSPDPFYLVNAAGVGYQNPLLCTLSGCANTLSCNSTSSSGLVKNTFASFLNGTNTDLYFGSAAAVAADTGLGVPQIVAVNNPPT